MMRRMGWGFIACAGLVWACGFDTSLREYLSVSFWQPFAKSGGNFGRPNVKRIDTAYAGMGPIDGTPVGKMRAYYRSDDPLAEVHAFAASALASSGLSVRDHEEIALIDAKVDMREGDRDDGPPEPEPLRKALEKLQTFLKTAKTPAWISEARGWVAHIDYLLGDRTAAGKIYLDELNRDGSNLSRDTLLTSLKMTYNYDGGQQLSEHLEDYFDTPLHAAFAVQLVTNPTREWKGPESRVEWVKARELLQKHRQLLVREEDSKALALLSMRTAMRMGDPKGALRIAAMIPEQSRIRREPDYLWMVAGARFVSRDYADAEAPLLQLFSSLKDDDSRKAAAAYGLCGVYQKTGNWVEQLRFALWEGKPPNTVSGDGNGNVTNFGVYWAFSGWDGNLLLDVEAPTEALEEFIAKYPDAPRMRSMKYALAVRRAREDKYGEAAAIYDEIGQKRRGPRMRQAEKLWADQSTEGKFRFAQFLSANEDGVYFNDERWWGLQNYALAAKNDARLTAEERKIQIDRERRLRDVQEEYWRSYQLLREVMAEAGRSELGRRAAQLAIRDLRKIRTDRFGRENEIAQADREVTLWLARK